MSGDPCQPIRDAISGLRAEITGLQEELNTAAPGEKPALIRLIRQTQQQLALRNQELTQCVAANPPPDPSRVILTTATCPVCTPEHDRVWRQIVDTQLGVDGFDPLGHWIGGFPAERFGPINNWYPLAVEKKVLCGRLHHFNFYDGIGAEADWNNFMIPTPAFAHLLQDAKIYEPNDEWHSCDGQDCMEAEITPDESYYENVLNSRSRGENGESRLEGQLLCTYGPWVREKAHGNRPEIHPSELYWWRGRFAPGSFYYMLMLVQDDSNRFDREDDYDFGTPWDNPPSGWRPWSKNPRRGIFRIAFALDPAQPPRIYQIRSVESLRVNPGGGHAERLLEYNGKVVLRVENPQAASNHVGITFSVCRNAADNRLQGYILLTTDVGQGDRGGEGYQTLRVDVDPITLVAEEVASWPLLPLAEPAPRRPSVQALALPRSLRRVEVDGRPQLRGDIELRPVAVPGAAATERDLSPARVELVAPNVRRALELRRSRRPATERASRRHVVEDLPAAAGSRLEVTLESGEVVALATPQIALAPRIVAEQPLRAAPDPSAWQAMVAAAGGRADGSPPPVPLVRASQWQLAAAPRYAPLRGGRAHPEDDSPFVEELNDVVGRNDAARVAELFGSGRPFTVQWSFEATNVATGTSVPVGQGASAAGSDVRVEEAPSDGLNAGLQVTFPEEPAGAFYELVATAKLTDAFGNEGEVRHRVWSHVLALEDQGRLAQLILPTAASLAEVSADDLVAAAALGSPRSLGAEDGPPADDPRSRRAAMVRLSALAAAEDQRIDVEELRVLIRGAQLFGRTP